MNVQSIVTDFEDAVLRATTVVFGHRVTTRGCFYHVTQATWRKIQNPGLVPTYNADEDFRLFCGMLDGLTFLPVEDVAEGMQYLRDNVPEDPPEAVELLD